jgi:hypothetical protein
VCLKDFISPLGQVGLETSNNIIEKGLALLPKHSGSVVASTGEAGQTKAPRPKLRGAERNVAPAGQTSGLPVNPENRYDQSSSGLIREIPDKEAS